MGKTSETPETQNQSNATDQPAEAPQTEAPTPEPTAEAASKQSKMSKLKQKLSHMSKKQKAGPVVVFVLLLGAIGYAIPPVRFAVLNLFMSEEVEVLVIDQNTQQPVPEARVSISGQTGSTNDEGRASITNVKLGNQTLEIGKEAYGPVSKTVTVNLGDNVFGPENLSPTGTPVTVSAINTISEQPLTDFKVTLKDSEVSATSDENGTAIISLPPQAEEKAILSISAEGFNNAEISYTASETDKTQVAKLTPA